MRRQQLEHILRAAFADTGAKQWVVVGSQAILGQFPEPPAELVQSIEADIFSLRSPEDANRVDGSIGEGSLFNASFGYYAHGVGEETAVLPRGWKERLVKLSNENTGGAVGLCLEVHDLAASKLVAGREKDLAFVSGLLRHGMADGELIRRRVSDLEIDETLRSIVSVRLARCSPSS